MKKNICIIPARANSRRIKNKNIINFFGKPIISYAISEAIKSKLFDRVIVSTDSKQIAQISIRYGASVPSLRPKKLSSHTSTINDVLKYCVKKYQFKNYKFLYCLFPMTPLLTSKDLIKANKKIIKYQAPHLISVKKNNDIKQKIFVNKNKKLILKDGKKTQFSKNIDYFSDNGNFFILELKKYKKGFKSNYKNTIGYEMIKKEANDINNLSDLNYLKFLYKKK
jgi:CMP-N-acetylneuraminic acid synthetase|tara:strand:+ start:56 stop:727 length:672 start_codon:yes stop_codon:yes gene_type:complete